MSCVQDWIKFLYPDQLITHHLRDLNNLLIQQNNNQKHICLSIEKNNKSRQFCSLTIDQLNTLYEYCPVTQRTLCESINSISSLKAYIDFEYYINCNPDLQDHNIGPQSCLKILYYLLNSPDNQTEIMENNHENILKQFLVLQASTTEKISYHFIHAKPSFLFDNISSLKVFIKTTIHYLLLTTIKHKCPAFNITISISQPTISDLIQLLTPYVITLRKHCSSCFLSIPNVSIADIAHLLILNKTNKYTIAIDMNVYSNNQQFRLFNSVKYGKNNPLIPSNTFPFNNQCQYSSSDLLQLSLISFNHDHQIATISFKNNQFNFQSITNSKSESMTDIANKSFHINLLNEHLKMSSPVDSPENSYTNNQNISHSLLTTENNTSNLFDQNIQIFTDFVENIIKSDSSHQGYILSCVPGNYNKNILFYNIGGNYRYCPKKNAHHHRNTVAIMINTKNKTYSIRCKDTDCDNTIINWKKI